MGNQETINNKKDMDIPQIRESPNSDPISHRHLTKSSTLNNITPNSEKSLHRPSTQKNFNLDTIHERPPSQPLNQNPRIDLFNDFDTPLPKTEGKPLPSPPTQNTNEENVNNSDSESNHEDNNIPEKTSPNETKQYQRIKPVVPKRTKAVRYRSLMMLNRQETE